MSAESLNLKERARPAKRMDYLLLALLLASLALNVYLGWNMAALKTAPRTQAVSFAPVPGTFVQPFTVSDLDGRQERISFNDVGKPTVIYVMSQGCEWCDRNVHNIKMLSGPQGGAFRFIGLSLTGENLKGYVDSNHFAFPVYMNPTPETVRALGLKSTPQTIVISPEGEVLKNWVGAYGERVRPEIEAFFGVRLPGLTAGGAIDLPADQPKSR